MIEVIKKWFILYEKEFWYFIEGFVYNKMMKNSDDILSWI